MKLRLKDTVKRLKAVRHLYLCVRAKEDRSYENAHKHYQEFRRGGWEKHYHKAFAADLQLLLGNGREALKGYLKVIEELDANRRSIAASDCRAASPCAVDHQPGDRSQWRGDRYRATVSEQAAWDRALRPKVCKLALSSGFAPNNIP